MENSLILCSTLHDPKGGLAGDLRQAWAVMKEGGCAGWVVNVTPVTSETVKKELASLTSEGIYLMEAQSDPAHRLTENVICDDHVRVVQEAAAVAKEQGIAKILYGDGDRMIMAAINYPDEFRSMMGLAGRVVSPEGSYVNFRRPPEDHLAHQAPLYATERVVCRLYSEALGMPIDIGSTVHGMSLNIAEEIVRRVPSMGVEYPHPAFLVAAKEAGATIQSHEVPHALTCETPWQSRQEVEAEFGRQFSSYKELQKAWKATTGLELLYSSQPKGEWERRFKLEGQHIGVLKDHLPNFGLDAEAEQKLLRGIEHAQEVMERRRSRTLEALSRIPEGTLKKRKARGKEALLRGLESE